MPEEKDKEEAFTIGDETFIIDPDAPEGDKEAPYTYLSDSLEMVEGYIEDKSGLVEDPHIREWKAATRPLPTKKVKPYAGIEPPGTLRKCKLPSCGKIVPPSKNIGAKKLFCSAKHGHRYHSKMNDRRNRGKGWHLEVDQELHEPVVFNRVKAPNEEQGNAAYLAHLESGICPLPGITGNEESWQGRCPGRFNQYSCEHQNNCTCKDKASRCLVYATLLDDMKEHWARREKLVYIRQFTTNDGRWIDRSELQVHMEPSKGLVPREVKG